MASIVKDQEAKSQDDEDRSDDRAEKSVDYRQPGTPEPKPSDRGFFHVYKPGQGYWTRMGTAGAALLVAGLTANFLYHQLPVWIGAAGAQQGTAKQIAIYTIVAFLAGYALLVFWLMNKPDNADFLIATDGEMKKVNWTSKKELWGSTKVVIFFMFLIATMLFAFDILFGYLFYFMGVLKSSPF